MSQAKQGKLTNPKSLQSNKLLQLLIGRLKVPKQKNTAEVYQSGCSCCIIDLLCRVTFLVTAAANALYIKEPYDTFGEN